MSKRGSQYGEDVWIHQNIKLPEHGVFVEVGAADGAENSNTLFFEDRGWTGLVIEPDPRQAAAIKANRKCVIELCAVSSLPGKRAFPLNAEPTWSGFDRGRDAVAFPLVKTNTLAALLEWHRLRRVDVLSIDTEGTELDVWASIGSHRPTVVIVEWERIDLPDHSAEIIERFEADGYAMVQRLGGNLIFRLSRSEATP